MGSPSPLTHPLASHVLLLSQSYHSPSLRWEAMQRSLCLILTFRLPNKHITYCTFHRLVKLVVNLTCVCVSHVRLYGIYMYIYMCVYDIRHCIHTFLSFLRLRSHDRLRAIIFAFEDKAIEILPLSQTMTDFHFSSLEELGTYISISLRPV